MKNTEDTYLKTAELNELKKEKSALEKRLEHLYDDRLNEIISPEQYISYNKKYDQRLSDIKARISSVKKELENNRRDAYENIKESVKKLLDTRGIDRELIEGLIDRIEFGEFDPETNRPVLKIFWAWE